MSSKSLSSKVSRVPDRKTDESNPGFELLNFPPPNRGFARKVEVLLPNFLGVAVLGLYIMGHSQNVKVRMMFIE